MVAKIGVFIALLSLFPLKTLAAAEEPPNLADAKKEGKVVLYVSAQLPLAQSISRAFEKKYPFLRVEITRTSGENLLNRIKTEKLPERWPSMSFTEPRFPSCLLLEL